MHSDHKNSEKAADSINAPRSSYTAPTLPIAEHSPLDIATTAKSKPTRRRRGSSTARERIFEATVKLVYEGGPGNATARNICDRANITAPTLYHYFGDLYLLYNEVLELMYVPEMEAHPGKELSDPLGMIDYMWQCCVGTAFIQPRLVELKNAMVASGTIPTSMMNFYARLERAFTQLGKDGKLHFAPDIAATMLWSAATGLATRIATGTHGVRYPAGADEALKQVLLDSILAAPKKKISKRGSSVSPPTSPIKKSANNVIAAKKTANTTTAP